MLNKLKNLFKKDEKGFTLVEILVVIIVIGILFTVLISRMDVAGDKAREKGIQTDFRAFSTASESLMRTTAGQSIDDASLNEYLDKAMSVTGTTSAKEDPWGVAYEFNFKEKDSTDKYSMITYESTGKGSDNFLGATYYYAGYVESCTLGLGTTELDSDVLALTGDCGSAVDESATDANL